MTAFKKKILAVLLALAMMVPSTSFVYAEDTAVMCQNHQQHDESCGYGAPSEGSPCTFVHTHDENCGYAEPSEGSPCTFVHEHDESCGYAAPSEGSPCTFVHEHDESCGYDETTGEGCTFVHEHDESCGYAAPSEGSPCTFVHEHDETCGYGAPSEGSPCTFVHEHDEYCGYAEPSEGSPCTHTCELCNPVTEEETEAVKEGEPLQVLNSTPVTSTPSTRSSYTSEDFGAKYTITNASGQIVTSLNTTDSYTVTITGVPDGYAFKNEETGEEFVSFGISNTEATDADSLQNTWTYIGEPEKQANGDWVLEGFRLNASGKGRFMTWFDGAMKLGYSAVYEITESEVGNDVKITNICYERLSGGSYYSFELYSEAFGLLEDKSTGTDYETFIRIYTANNETGSSCNVTDLFELEDTTFYVEDARSEKHALEHNVVLMGGSVQESYIDIKLSPLYIGNDKGITFGMPTSWTNPDRDKLIVSKAEVYVNGTLSRSVTMSDGRPGEEPSSRIFSLGMSMSGTSPTYTLNGRFEKDVVVSLDVLYPNGIGATIYNGTAEIEISSNTAFQLNGAGTAATSHKVTIPITGGSGSFRVISATTGDGDLFLQGGTAFTVKATLVPKAGEQYDVTEQTDSFTLSEENQYTKYTGTLIADDKAGVAINITIGDNVTSAVTDDKGEFTFFAKSGLKEVDVIRVVPQGETGFYLYNQPVTENTLTIKLEDLEIPIDLEWITHNEISGETEHQTFTEEEYDNIEFHVNQNSRVISSEIREEDGKYYLVLKNLLEIKEDDYFFISYKISNYTRLYAYPKGTEIKQGLFKLEKEITKAGSITAEFDAGINENDYVVGIYKKYEGSNGYNYTRIAAGKSYNPELVSSYGTYRVVFSTYLPDYTLYEEDFELGEETNSLYYGEVTGGLGIDETVTLDKELSKSDYYNVLFYSQKISYKDTDGARKRYFSMVLKDYSANLFGKVLRFDIPDNLEIIPDENGENTVEISYGTYRTNIKLTKSDEGYYISEPLPEAENAQSRQYTICVTITMRQVTNDSGTVTASVQNLGGSGYIVLGNVHIEGRSDVSVSASPLVYQDGILEYSLNCDAAGGILNGEVIEISEKYNKFKPFSIRWESYGTSYPLYHVGTVANIEAIVLEEELEWTNGEPPQDGEQLILRTKIQDYKEDPVVAGTTTYTSQPKPSGDFVEYLLCRDYISINYTDYYEDYYIIHPEENKNTNTINYSNSKKVYEAKINKDELPEGKEIYTMAVVMHLADGKGNMSFFLEPTEEDDSIWTRTNEFYQLPYISRYSLAYSFRPKVELPEETDTAINFDYEEYQADLETLSDTFGQSVTSIEQQSGTENGYDYSGFATTVNIGEIGETEVTMYSSSVGFDDGPEAFYSQGNVYRGKATMADGEVVDVVSRAQMFRCDDPDDPSTSNMIELTDFDVDSIQKFYQEDIKPETIFVQYVTSSVIKDGKYYDFDTYCNEASGQSDSGRSVFLASARNGASNGKFVGKGGGVKPKSDTSSDLQDFGSQTAITFTSDAVQGAVETGRFVDRFSTGAGLVSGALSGIGHSMEFGPVINDIENCIARARNVRDRYGEYLTDAEIQTLNQNISNMEYYLGVTKAGFAGAIGTDVAGVGIGLGAAALAPATGGGSVAAGFALNGNVTLGAFASEQIMKKNYNNVMELDASTFKILKDVTARRREAIPSVDNSSLYTPGVAVDMTDGYTYNSGNSSKAVLDGGIGHGGGGGIYGGGTIDQNQLVWIKYDPQGTVYDQDGNPVEDATMTVYFSKNADGSGAVAWVNEGEPSDAGDAAYEEIKRPWLWNEPGVQETNAVGFYAWNVPDGYYYQVVAEKDGYTTAKSEWLRVIPPRFGVDLVMTNLNAGGDDDDDENNNTGTGGGGGGGGGSSSVSYGISVSDDIANGKLTVSDKRAKKGDTVTITTAPDDGYALDTVTVKDEKGKEIKLTDLGNGKFSFTMPDSKITIDAQFVEKTDEIPVVINPFADVKESDWFYNDVMFVYSNGIMAGTGETTFEPNTTTNRAMFVAVVWRLENMPAPENTASFTDVEKGTWYTEAAAWAYENGIASGFGDGTFGPNEKLTREQLAVFLYKYAQYKGYDLTITGNIDSFIDKDSVSPWAKDAVTWAVQNGFIAGKDGNKLDPKGFATRAEFAAIIHRFIENMG
jgi:hypothetical protein